MARFAYTARDRSGKTTTAEVLLGTLNRLGRTVTYLDGDIVFYRHVLMIYGY